MLSPWTRTSTGPGVGPAARIQIGVAELVGRTRPHLGLRRRLDSMFIPAGSAGRPRPAGDGFVQARSLHHKHGDGQGIRDRSASVRPGAAMDLSADVSPN